MTSQITSDPYQDFLRAKAALAPVNGFHCSPDEVHPVLLPHQRACVVWAVRGGQRALFESFGLGKSVQQLEVVRLTVLKSGGKRGLIVCPLGVRQEFIRDAAMLGLSPRFVRRSDEVDAPGIYLTNYESVRDGRLDPSLFDVASLDEASVLRSYGSKTYQTFLTLFKAVPYRFVATATPSPNRLKELIHYAGFLGIMDTGQSLTRWFQRDSTQANNLTLHPHKEREFWLWVSSWAIFLQRPSDLGYSDAGYDLPPVEVVFHEIEASSAFGKAETNGQTTIMVDSSVSLSDGAREKRDSLPARIAQMKGIIDCEPQGTHFLLWHTLENERHAIKSALPEAVSVYGTQDMDEREQAIMDFSDGRIKYLSTKPEIAGSGCNFQRHCHNAIFTGVDYRANDLMQAVHRIQRFQQPYPCKVHLIYTEAERQIVKTLMQKWENHKTMVEKMVQIIKEYGINGGGLAEELARSIGVKRIEVSGQHFRVANNDAVLEARERESSSIDLIVTSIPFANHYEYTASFNDFGHTDTNGHFWEQMDYLTPELKRILQPGRLACVHVKDRILFGGVTGAGAPTVSPFHCEAIQHYIKHGFDFMGMITVVTDVVRENNQTYRLGWTENSKDGTKMGCGSPEYILLMRKPQSDRAKGYADLPVLHEKSGYTRARWQVDAHAFWRSSGQRQLTADEMASYGPATLASMFTQYSLENVYDFEFHVRIGEELEARGALPSSFMSLAPGSHNPDVWHDVNRMITLNTAQVQKNREAHICPLQFDIVDRLIERYSNAGEMVYDPFCGLGTVPLRAMKLGRRGGGSELSASYFLDSVQYLKAMEEEISMPTLFDLEELSAGSMVSDEPPIEDDPWSVASEFDVYVGTSGQPHRVTFTPFAHGKGEWAVHHFEFRGSKVGGISNTGYKSEFVPVEATSKHKTPISYAQALAVRLFVETLATQKSVSTKKSRPKKSVDQKEAVAA